MNKDQSNAAVQIICIIVVISIIIISMYTILNYSSNNVPHFYQFAIIITLFEALAMAAIVKDHIRFW